MNRRRHDETGLEFPREFMREFKPGFFIMIMTGGTAPILLLSMPHMADPNFAPTVVLL